MTTKRITGAAGRQLLSDGVREALRTGTIVPGQRLIEQDLSDEYGVTRSAIREAFLDLASDGLVELVPNRGARIRSISVDEAIQITECRAALERLCARKAAEYASKEQRAELKAVGREMKAAVTAAEFETYSALNRRLHDLIIAISGQDVAKRQLQRLNAQTVRYQFRLSQRPGRPKESLPQHLAIISAIAAGDVAAADAAMAAHLDSVIDQLALAL